MDDPAKPTASLDRRLLVFRVIAVLVFVGMTPLFLGLFVVLPVLGHASWHMYRRLMPPEA